ncbi:hypothetical protein KDA_06300 [Dictyobacter alpinus]|uniref:HTH gntR-type domain-containing protein n=1 Tax=Dictyobacter alpinus TaxID=2014873 RepID=A0A402B1C2_9CHLR|nr:substrate-binding domain-containing protein [Dictyobacter alpinus]GCE25146.1 hypothetical protein KDA_06300 [Dictyobacter alpinus]
MVEKQKNMASTKSEELYKRVREMAYEKGPDAQLPTMRALCEELKTTRVTLGEVLQRLEAEQVIYSKSRQGIFVSPRIHTRSIHIFFDLRLLLSTTISPFWSMLLIYLEQEMQLRNATSNEMYRLHIARPELNDENTLPSEAPKLLQLRQADAFVSIGFHSKGWLLEWPVPCVTFAGNGQWIVQLDGLEYGRLAADQLIRQGCKRIGIWSRGILPVTSLASPTEPVQGPYLPLEHLDDFVGFRDELKRQEIPIHPELMRLPPVLLSRPALTYQEQGYLLASEVFGSPHQLRPDGLFITDDLLADGALAAFDDFGIEVKKDVKIVTHTNVGSPILFHRSRHMTIFEFDPEHIVREMFTVLDTLLAGQQPSQQVRWIKPRLRLQA